LNIKNATKLRVFAANLGTPAGPAWVFGRGHCHARPPNKTLFGDAHIVCGDDYRVHFLRPPATFPDVAEKRLVRNEMERFSRKTRGAPPRGNDSNCLTHLLL